MIRSSGLRPTSTRAISAACGGSAGDWRTASAGSTKASFHSEWGRSGGASRRALGGRALLYEKIVACASDRMIVIADASKRVPVLGAFPLPVEVVPFGVAATRQMVELLAADAGCSGEIKLRSGADGRPFVTDAGHYILDCAFGRIEEPDALDEALKLIPGVVEHGLFLGLADIAIIAGPEGVAVLQSTAYDPDAS